ncbi:MAG: glycosyltransferase family 2 protein, partial [Flavobacteriales bacterium]|nr:glycosyltransferase family 2 protein [Flavobacteriales bacterium]
MPAVSTLLPFRNAATTLHTAIASLAAQTFGDQELLLIDHPWRGDRHPAGARALSGVTALPLQGPTGVRYAGGAAPSVRPG